MSKKIGGGFMLHLTVYECVRLFLVSLL